MRKTGHSTALRMLGNMYFCPPRSNNMKQKNERYPESERIRAWYRINKQEGYFFAACGHGAGIGTNHLLTGRAGTDVQLRTRIHVPRRETGLPRARVASGISAGHRHLIQLIFLLGTTQIGRASCRERV